MVQTISSFAQSPGTKSLLLTHIAAEPARNDFAILTAKIRTGTDTANAYCHLDTLLATGYGDMFWMYGCAGLYYSCADQLRPEYKAKIRDAWKHRTPYRGDTENHFLMYYGSLLLMSQAWPDLVDSEWFMGKSSREIYAESVDYLDHWIDETVREGTTEWSSPRYAYYYITPLLLLAEYTKDARLKHRFEMMLKYMLADYASDYLNGAYCGAHSRVSDEAALNPRSAEINAYGQYFFEDTVTHVLPDLAFATMTSFTCPKIIRDIARDRSKPYEQYSFKRGRQMIRYMDEWRQTGSGAEDGALHADSTNHAPVYKYEYMTKDYCLGSMQGGIVQPIQQQSWSLVFNSDKPNKVITGLHPFVSADELGMFFPEYPSYQLESISKVKKGYTSEVKWVGGSPYERIYQDKNVLLASYEIPKSAQYSHVDIYIPFSAGEVLVDTSKAIEYALKNFQPDIAHHGVNTQWRFFTCDSTVVALWCSKKPEIRNEELGRRFRLYGDTLEYGVVCVPNPGNQDSMVELEGTLFWSGEYMLHRYPHFGERKKRSDLLFTSPFLESKKGSSVLTIKDHGEKLILDFKK